MDSNEHHKWKFHLLTRWNIFLCHGQGVFCEKYTNKSFLFLSLRNFYIFAATVVLQR